VNAASADSLRKQKRAQRAALESDAIEHNALQLRDRVAALPEYQQACHVAAYIAIRGEMDPLPLMQHSRSGKQFYLPVLRDQQMRFAPWMPGQPLHSKQFGLLEPDCDPGEWKPATELDLVLVPLVVFDPGCNRVGQGGGYYDRTFAHRRDGTGTPLLLGIAHDFQAVQRLQPQSWDVPLDKIATEARLYTRQ